MSQLTLQFETRRIDVTLDRLANVEEALSVEERSALQREDWWNIVILVTRVRAMERAEEPEHRRLGLRTDAPLADAYDRVVQPGVGHPVDAILRTFKAAFADPGPIQRTELNHG